MLKLRRNLFKYHFYIINNVRFNCIYGIRKGIHLKKLPRIYLEFEKPIQEIDDQILELRLDPKKTEELAILKNKRILKIENIYSNLSRW